MVEYRVLGNHLVLTDWMPAGFSGGQLVEITGDYGHVVLAPVIREDIEVFTNHRQYWERINSGLRIEFREVLANANESQEALTDRAPDQRGPDDVPDA